MIDNVLYIIGNGFDRHHNIASSYTDFRDWLRRTDPELFHTYSGVCRYDALWTDFENGMAYVDRDFFIARAELFLPDYSVEPDEWGMADIMLAGDVARDQAYELLDELKTAFYRWIKSLKAPKEYESRKLMIDYDARFLTFNYTEFLESHYGIDHNQIKYLHGHRLEGRKSIVVGHGGDDEAFDRWWTARRYDRPRYNRKGKKYWRRDTAWKTYGSQLPEFEGIADGLQTYYEESRKPVERLLRENEAYFADLYDVGIIYVWGFSFNPIDLPYIRAIVGANDNPDTIRWYVSYWGDSEKDRLEGILVALGVDVSRQVTFRPLSFWMMPGAE